MRTRVKICCIGSAAEVRAAVMAGADAVGVVGAMPSGPGPVDDDTARAVVAEAPPGVGAFLLTSEVQPDAIIDHVLRIAAPVVQIVRHVDPASHALLRAAAPWVKIVQVVHVEDETSLELARGYSRSADCLLLDSGRPEAEVAELGGTGRRHDWSLSRRIVSLVDKPVYLAGGLNEFNVGEAIEVVRPFGVDLCSGVRTMGKLDIRKLSGFFAAVKLAH
jgi:phosphoribosylanthranilate isomerase